MAARTDFTKIKKALIGGLSHLKQTPSIAVRKSHVGNNLYLFVVSDSFSRMSLTKRHQLVEEVLQREIEADILQGISALFVLTRKEADDGFFPTNLVKRDE